MIKKMKINRTTKFAAIFAIIVIAAAMFIVWFGNHKALQDVEEFEQTGKSKYEAQIKEIQGQLNININNEDDE
jgi:uncharacterized membrane protein